MLHGENNERDSSVLNTVQVHTVIMFYLVKLCSEQGISFHQPRELYHNRDVRNGNQKAQNDIAVLFHNVWPVSLCLLVDEVVNASNVITSWQNVVLCKIGQEEFESGNALHIPVPVVGKEICINCLTCKLFIVHYCDATET